MMTRKRKFQDEQLGLHQSNHRSFDQKNCRLLPGKSQANIVDKIMMNDQIEGGGESDSQDSAKGSNNLLDFSSSVYCSSSTANLGFRESDALVGDSGLYGCPDYEDRYVEFREVEEFDFKSGGTEVYSNEKVIEDLLCSKDATTNKFILSSGRWDVNQDQSEKSKNSLTIDKEFEQYFSMLML